MAARRFQALVAGVVAGRDTGWCSDAEDGIVGKAGRRSAVVKPRVTRALPQDSYPFRPRRVPTLLCAPSATTFLVGLSLPSSILATLAEISRRGGALAEVRVLLGSRELPVPEHSAEDE